jgi:hypothetical protein
MHAEVSKCSVSGSVPEDGRTAETCSTCLVNSLKSIILYRLLCRQTSLLEIPNDVFHDFASISRQMLQ